MSKTSGGAYKYEESDDQKTGGADHTSRTHLFQSTSSLPTTQLQSEQQKKKQTRHRHTCEFTLGRLVIARPKSRQSPVFEFHDRGSVRVASPTPSLTVRAAHPRSSSQCRPAGICTSALPTYPFQAAPLPLSANGHLHATRDRQ